ncbi:MAG: carboxypeptidase regulatory-like domain-containing protein [Crocinitomicaceae bacterium]|nr:carboxypeptidase regulatory-like domain-containing protein [Crocinitomicaceae bacterium]
MEGNYRIDGLKPGVYNLFARSTGFDTAMIVAINVRPDALTFVDIENEW